MSEMQRLKQLWSSVPILSVKEIAKRLNVTTDELEQGVINSGFASADDYGQRSRFISYCLSGTHQKRCKYCSIVLKDYTRDILHKNISGCCVDCFERFQPRRYNYNISWYRNMMIEKWLPTNDGWQNENTGIFLPKRYQSFFMENNITP